MGDRGAGTARALPARAAQRRATRERRVAGGGERAAVRLDARLWLAEPAARASALVGGALLVRQVGVGRHVGARQRRAAPPRPRAAGAGAGADGGAHRQSERAHDGSRRRTWAGRGKKDTGPQAPHRRGYARPAAARLGAGGGSERPAGGVLVAGGPPA